MTDPEIALALENLIRQDAKRPSPEQIQDLIEAGVIDQDGRVLIGNWDKKKPVPASVQQNGSTKKREQLEKRDSGR
jgi:hypothetical protein